MIYHFIEALVKKGGNQDVAECLYTGIMDDTQVFVFVLRLRNT